MAKYRAISVIFSLYGFLVFLILMLVLFPAVVFASFFGRVTGGNMIYTICRFWTNSAFLMWGIRYQPIFEAPVERGHPMVFVFNHVSYIDIPMWLKATEGNHIRVLGKAEMARIPIFGYIYKEAAILVDRSNAAARAKSIRELKFFLSKNISVVIAPEGTFNMTSKPLGSFFDGAFRIAIETQTPIKPVVFPDVQERLNHHSIFSLSPGKSRAIFLPEIPVTDYTIEDIQLLKQRTYTAMEDALLRYKASWIK